MNRPLMIDIPHNLGRAEARRRMNARIGELPAHIPGGLAEVESSWPSEDRMAIAVKVMGKTVLSTADVTDEAVRVRVELPLMLSFLSGMIESIIRQKGQQLLIPPKSDGQA